MKVELINEVHKSMQDYAENHYGMPHGPDFLRFAEEMAKSEEISSDCLVSVMLIGLGGKELAENVKTNLPPDVVLSKSDEARRRLTEIVSKSTCFQQYIEIAYLGYLIGRRAAEVENLEGMASL